MSHQGTSVKSILFALLANFGIAITKTVATILTGSGASGGIGLELARIHASKGGDLVKGENLKISTRWSLPNSVPAYNLT